MQTRTKWMTGGAAVAAVALLAWAFAPRPVEVEVAPAARTLYEAAVEEDGKTRLRERYVVAAPVAGRLARITLREGDAVAAGAVLAQVAPAQAPLLDARARREQQERVATADAQVQRALARVDAARVAWERARSDAQRNTQLAEQGFVAPARQEADQLAVQAAQAERDTAAQDLDAARHNAAQARVALLGASDGTAAAVAVRAPVAGRVLKVLQPSEGNVAPGTALLELGDVAQLEVVAELLTTDALRIAAGAPVVIDRWGGPGTLAARVRLVEPGAFTKVSALGVEEQRVRVVAELTSPRDQWQALGDGWRVVLRVVTTREPDALCVPVGAVFPRTDAQGGGMAVFVVEGGRARVVPVELAGRNGSLAWVRQGLQPGQRVIVFPPAAVQDGVRVKVRQV